MYRERWRTRDLLLEYDKNIMPPRPRAAGLGSAYYWGNFVPSTDTNTILPVSPIQTKLDIIYPWENTALSIFSHELYKVMLIHGFAGTEEEFYNGFLNYVADKEIIFDTFNNFPENGSNQFLYFDLTEKILYYWEDEYKPVNALLIENSILNGGSSTESID